MTLRFDGQVAIVTGAGRGLGRSYAHLLAERGAAVVVNDPGVELEGQGGDAAPANTVVGEILAAGGRAVANLDAVGTQDAADRIVDVAIRTYGRIDILINNAGTVPPVLTYEETSADSFDSVYKVHVNGSNQLIRAVWPHMTGQHYGKILNILSSVGYIGARGMLPYGVAKAALHGLTRGLSLESLDHGICVNGLAPGALTRPLLTYHPSFGAELADAFATDLVAPTAIWLVHKDCKANGEMLSTMAGTTTRYRVGETAGFSCRRPTPEAIRDNFDAIMGENEGADLVTYPTNAAERTFETISKFESMSAEVGRFTSVAEPSRIMASTNPLE